MLGVQQIRHFFALPMRLFSRHFVKSSDSGLCCSQSQRQTLLATIVTLIKACRKCRLSTTRVYYDYTSICQSPEGLNPSVVKKYVNSVMNEILSSIKMRLEGY